MKEKVKKRIDELRQEIHHHDYLYYVKNNPEISDKKYDSLFKELEELEKKYPEYEDENSPTKRVGAPPLDSLKKVRHISPMLSLQGTTESKDIHEFHRYVQEHREKSKGKQKDSSGSLYTLEPKFDGLGVEIMYRKGEFDYGATRGDGMEGEDISENLRTIPSIPLTLLEKEEVPELLSVRGEVYLPKGPFQELNKRRIESGENSFANPRNAAAGIVRQLDPKKVADKPLSVVFYEVLALDGKEISTHEEELQAFTAWGLPTNKYNTTTSTLEEIEEFHQSMKEKRDDLEYEIDGIVIKCNHLKDRETLGARERSPRWAIAWKFPPKKEITTIHSIITQVGRTGMLTPVALLEPVDVGGVTVEKVTLHNEGEVQKKDLRPGDKVKVIRAGDVIPEITERIKERGKKRGKKFSMPKHCPSCGTKIVREGAYYFCPAHLNCPAQVKGQIVHFASREALNIEGLGEKTVETLVDTGTIENISDIYTLTKDDLLSFEGFAEKSAKQLREEIQSKKQIPLDTFLYALGIRHVGKHMAGVLASSYLSLEGVMKKSKKELEKIDEIGPEIADSVFTFFQKKENLNVIEELREAGVKITDMPKEKKDLPLKGKTFVFTGALKGYSRKDAESAVEELGARAVSSVSGNTDYLVAGEDPGSKLEDAREEDNITIIGEEDFIDLISR